MKLNFYVSVRLKTFSPALYLASSLPLVEGRAGEAWELQRNIFYVPSVINLVPVTTSLRYLHVFLLSFFLSFILFLLPLLVSRQRVIGQIVVTCSYCRNTFLRQGRLMTAIL